MSIRIAKETAPSTPPADKAYIYLDTADNDVKIKDDAGSIINLSSIVSNATHTGDVTGSTALTIANSAVTTAKIADNAITTAKIFASNVTESKLATDAVSTTKIVDDAVTNTKLSNMLANTIKGRVTDSTGDPEDLTASQARTVLGLATTDTPTFSGVTLSDGFLSIGSNSPQLTISGGVITVTDSYHQIDTEGAAATDDLDTINGTAIGRILVLGTVTSARDITLKDGTGNLRLAGDFVMDHSEDRILLIGGTSNWHELCRSNNAP